ncbi:MAG TPA: hypothetical protein PKJ12_07210 [Ottowia sp.]|nr:MAG: hypothetical protein E6Q64_00130 [Ottowia sp.]HNE60557.1 hypothetical protein [Ottowia sp.]HNK52382.1 hypothetical protein [Ottowia sp.]HNL41181.1 hypothetical protein [Ottowia sp.]HNO42368.1 hypothetical protein [Ottowia sp.]
MTRAIPRWLLALVALAALLLALLWLAPGPSAAWRHWQAPPAQAPRLDDVQAALLRPNPGAATADPVVLERPLFSPSRRPQSVAVAAAPEAPPPPDIVEQVKLQGVLAGRTLNGVLIEEAEGTRFVRIGQTVGDWMLTRANAAGARFERQGQQRTVSWPTPAADPSQPSQHPAQGQRPNRARP